MTAHPMIAPLLPLRAPADIAATYADDAAQAYALMWTNTLGHLKRPAQVDEHICHFGAAATPIGLRALTTGDPVLLPLLRELDAHRMDPSPLPLGGVIAPSGSALTIQSVDSEWVAPPGRDTDTESLIAWLDRLRVVSPGRLGSILEEMASEKEWIKSDGHRYRLTGQGETQLQRLEQAGTLCIEGATIARWHAAIEGYIHGNQELTALLKDSNALFGCALDLPIDQLETMITDTQAPVTD